MFDEIRDDITRKFLELKLWVYAIPSSILSEPESAFVISLRGLFFVYLYGVFENIVSRIVMATIASLNEADLTVNTCIYELYALVFSGEYDSIENVGRAKKWVRRWDVSERFLQDSPVQIQGDLFPTDGKNIRYDQLESIINSFGLKQPILCKAEIRGYLDDLVNNRNAIAHGDKTPFEVGKRYTKKDLLKRCSMILEESHHLCDIFEDYIVNEKYLK